MTDIAVELEKLNGKVAEAAGDIKEMRDRTLPKLQSAIDHTNGTVAELKEWKIATEAVAAERSRQAAAVLAQEEARRGALSLHLSGKQAKYLAVGVVVAALVGVLAAVTAVIGPALHSSDVVTHVVTVHSR